MFPSRSSSFLPATPNTKSPLLPSSLNSKSSPFSDFSALPSVTPVFLSVSSGFTVVFSTTLLPSFFTNIYTKNSSNSISLVVSLPGDFSEGLSLARALPSSIMLKFYPSIVVSLPIVSVSFFACSSSSSCASG